MVKRFILFLFAVVLCSLSPVKAQKLVLFQCPIDIELSNDQGEMPTSDYLKNYGTKRKTRAQEYLHMKMAPFIQEQFAQAGFDLFPLDTLSSVKCNVYGCPNLSLNKAVKTGMADQYLRVHLKDIGLVETPNSTDPFQQSRKTVKVRCKIQIYGTDKKLIQNVEGFFESGEPVTHPEEINVDLRKYRGDAFMQELSIYEISCKMAVINALAELD